MAVSTVKSGVPQRAGRGPVWKGSPDENTGQFRCITYYHCQVLNNNRCCLRLLAVAMTTIIITKIPICRGENDALFAQLYVQWKSAEMYIPFILSLVGGVNLTGLLRGIQAIIEGLVVSCVVCMLIMALFPGNKSIIDRAAVIISM